LPMHFLLRPGVLLAVAATSLVVATASVATLTWIVIDPQYWFPGAFAEQGEQGLRGVRGPKGPVGPPGPVGPDAEDAIASVAFDLEDLSASVTEVQDALEALESDVFSGDDRLDELEAGLEEVATRLQDICDEFYYYTGAFEDIYFAAC
jgi:hypothetical protein